MALIKCIDCNKEFSDKAEKCPNCGCPTEYVLKQYQELEDLRIEEAKLTGLKRESRKFKVRDKISINLISSITTTEDDLIVLEDSIIAKKEIRIPAKTINRFIQNYSSNENKGNIVIFYNDEKIFLEYGYNNDKFNRVFSEIALEIEAEFIENRANQLSNQTEKPMVNIGSGFIKRIVKTRIIDGNSRKSMSSSVIRGAVGGFLLGPVGLLGGAVSGKNKRTTTFLIFYSDGSKKTVDVKNNSFEYKNLIRFLE